MAIVSEIDRLIDDHTDMEIADILNARGLRPGVADRFSNTIIYQLRKKYRLGDRFDRLRREGLLTLEEATAAFHLNPSTIKNHAARGRVVSFVYNDKGQRLYAPPGDPPLIPCGHCGKSIGDRGKHGQRRKYCNVNCRTGAYARRRAAVGWLRVRRHA